MNIIKTKFKDLLVIEPKVWGDHRGYFFESFNAESLATQGVSYPWIQDNEAYSEKGVLRGLHYQKAPEGQTKLVRVAFGEVLDVVVDIRPKSETYGQSFSLILSGKNKKQLLVPKGFAHGYVVLSESALFLYKVDSRYNPALEEGIFYGDDSLNIDWVLPSEELIISEKDSILPSFAAHNPYN